MESREPNDPVHEGLVAMHEAVGSNHAAERAVLLDRLTGESIALSDRSTAWRFTAPLAVAACLLLAAFVAVLLARPASAMDRIARAINRVSSYAYRLESVYTSTAGEGRVVRDMLEGQTRRSPGALNATTKVVEVKGTNSSEPAPPKTLVDLRETHAVGGPGIVVDHLKREFLWTPVHEMDNDLGRGGPQVLIRKVRERMGRVVRELGEKQLGGRHAYGIEMVLDAEDPASGWDDDGEAEEWIDWKNLPVEVWVDAETDLPIEFRAVRRGEDYETIIRVTDLRWNVEFAEDHFRPKPPEGYTEVSMPASLD